MGAVDTRFPFILFVSQAETEDVLGRHVRIERGVELVTFAVENDAVHCVLRHSSGEETV